MSRKRSSLSCAGLSVSSIPPARKLFGAVVAASCARLASVPSTRWCINPLLQYFGESAGSMALGL